jgi:hypothetical protein
MRELLENLTAGSVALYVALGLFMIAFVYHVIKQAGRK